MSTPNPTLRGTWLALSGMLFLAFIVVGLLLVMAFNGGAVNHLLTPVGSYFSMFRLIWPEQPLGALQFILTKSFIVFAHRDPHSGLNTWTLEYDAVGLAVYALAALGGARLLLPLALGGKATPGLGLGLAGVAGLVFSATYMTAVAHCAGPTWAGFVSLFGLGMEDIEQTLLWQVLLGLAGLGLLGYALHRQRRA